MKDEKEDCENKSHVHVFEKKEFLVEAPQLSEARGAIVSEFFFVFHGHGSIFNDLFIEQSISSNFEELDNE